MTSAGRGEARGHSAHRGVNFGHDTPLMLRYSAPAPHLPAFRYNHHQYYVINKAGIMKSLGNYDEILHRNERGNLSRARSDRKGALTFKENDLFLKIMI